MFNFLKKKTPPSTTHELQSTILKLQGLHCSSCATNIDLVLEDLPSVESTTSYAKQQTKVSFNPKETSMDTIKSTVSDLGYSISQIE